MKDDELENTLRHALRTERAPDLSENAIDTILLGGKQCSPEMLVRIRRRFTEKLFLEKYPEPVKVADGNNTFGDFLEMQRSGLNLRTIDIANALGLEEAMVDSLEKGRALPWKTKPKVITDVMALFRVHMEALRRLVDTTLAVSQVTGIGQVSARSQRGRIHSSRGDSTGRALERFFARKSGDPKPDAEVAEWLAQVEIATGQAGLDDLLSSK